MGFLRLMISPVQKTLSSMHSVTMGMLPDTMRIATVCTTVSSWKTANCANTIFQVAIQTEIYGLSDATGALTGNFIDASGVRRGFSGGHNS